MTPKAMEQGVVRVGHIDSGFESGAVVSATFDAEGVEVIWPREIGFVDAWDRNETGSTPDTLIFRDHGGYLTFRDGISAGLSMSTMGSSEQKIRFRSAIETGQSGNDYAKLNGMTSEIEGLADWAKLHPVKRRIEPTGNPGSPRVILTAENLEPYSLGGPFEMSLETSFLHDPSLAPDVYALSGSLILRTQSAGLVPWDEHAATHHMLQDLMCLVYGRPCRAWLRNVMRLNDQPFEVTDNRYWWPNAYQPTFGRSAGEPNADKTDRDPLFHLDETQPERVSNWLTEFRAWSRPTWIAVTTLFQRNSTVEAQLLQIGIALEALGYAIWRRDSAAGGRTPVYEKLLEHVTSATDIEHRLLFGDGRTADDWRSDFNKVFKGAKHADRPLPEGRDAYEKARQGFLLIRCWLAVELGVSPATIRRRLDTTRTGTW